MIAFSCACGMKFKVKDEYAGRSTKCPTCKHALVVPLPDKTVIHVPEGQIDGTASSLVQAGVDGGVTVGQVVANPGQKSVSELLARQTKKGQRYIIEKEIARGGMGAVLRAVDCDIRREVAVKYMLVEGDRNKKLRFIEEAQITGQLEHPNIVPIHELGVDAQKRVFFSMKMVKGRSLQQILDDLRTNPKQTEYSLGRLLNILVNVCNGLAYAHSRGVVHRDLKPANIMVGDFGEVYVMDWGLAKVLRGNGQVAPMASLVAGPAPSALASSSGEVATSREPDADLTQEGAILGTPVYMPPEQATGHIDAIDQRSDVYSLGAILYEMLTLQAPIEKEGGYLAILMRVAQGEIVLPEQRNRTRSIPRELSAIAMKALSKEPGERYHNVESLRRDIERFQEGRSVSAKEDTFREAVWKLVKRNKAVSALTTVALIFLISVWGRMSWVNGQERLRTEKERQAKFDQAKNSVPAFVRAARLLVNEKQFDDALAQVNIALEYDHGNADAQLLKGKVLVVKQDFKKAETELEQYLQSRPKDQFASKLIELCRLANVNDPSTIAPFVDHFLGNQEFALGLGMGDFRDTILVYYRQRIEKAWAGLGDRLNMDTDSKLDLNLDKCSDEVTELAPLQGMPLTRLSLGSCTKITDLKPLTGMPLISLNLSNCALIRDLTPLKGMPLTKLSAYGCVQIKDLSPLKGMPLTSLAFNHCFKIQDLSPLKGMPITTMSLYNCPGVRDLTPLEGMALETIAVAPKNIAKGMDVLRRMKSLKTIHDGSKEYPAAEFWKRYDAGEFNK